MDVILIKRQVLQSATSDAESHPLFGLPRTVSFSFFPLHSDPKKKQASSVGITQILSPIRATESQASGKKFGAELFRK